MRKNFVLIENRGVYTVNPAVGFVFLGVKNQPVAGVEEPRVGEREGGGDRERLGVLDSEERRLVEGWVVVDLSVEDYKSRRRRWRRGVAEGGNEVAP